MKSVAHGQKSNTIITFLARHTEIKFDKKFSSLRDIRKTEREKTAKANHKRTHTAYTLTQTNEQRNVKTRRRSRYLMCVHVYKHMSEMTSFVLFSLRYVAKQIREIVHWRHGGQKFDLLHKVRCCGK